MSDYGLSQDQFDAWMESGVLAREEGGRLLFGMRHTWETVELPSDASDPSEEQLAEIERLQQVLHGIEMQSAIKDAFASFWKAQLLVGYLTDAIDSNTEAEALYEAREQLRKAWLPVAHIIDANRKPLGPITD